MEIFTGSVWSDGSFLPGNVVYAYFVAKDKVGLDAAITGPTSWSFKLAMGTASADVATDTQLHGCIYMRSGGILVAKYSDGSDACTYTVTGGWLATDELIVVLYTDGITIQIGIVDSGAYSLGVASALIIPKEVSGFDGGLIDLSLIDTFGSLLYYNADIATNIELVGGLQSFNSSILGTQYKRNSAGDYVAVTAGGPIADTFDDGFIGLRSVGAITNLLPGDTSGPRVATLTAQTYTLQVFGSGSASCSYGTATATTPLKFIATAGATTFTPSGASLWMLTASSYPLPYVPPGVTQPASNATSTNGVWFANPSGSALWTALSGGPLTLATKIRMGVGSSDLPVSQSLAIMSSRTASREQYSDVNAGGTAFISGSFSGAVYNSVPGTWEREAVVIRITQVNTAGTQFRVGYAIEGTHTVIQWGSWAVYDGSFDPSTIYRLMYGYNNSYPMWLNKLIIWNTQVSDADLLEVLL